MNSPLNNSRRNTFRIKALMLFSICAFTFNFVSQSYCEDYYVNNVAGDDNNDGLARPLGKSQGGNGPFKTISKALTVARHTDRIFVEKTDTPYRECLSIQGPRHNGSSYKKFRIFSDGAILDGTRPVNDKWEYFRDDIYRFRPELKSYQQLYRDGRPIPQTRLDSFDSPDSLQVDQWTLKDGWIYFKTDGRDPLRYDLSYCFHPVGITLYQVHDVMIEGLVIQGFQLDGINAHDMTWDIAVMSNIVRGNGRSGISVGGASRVNLIANLLGDNGEAQLRTEGYSKTWVDNCEIIDSDKFGTPIDQSGGEIIEVDSGK